MQLGRWLLVTTGLALSVSMLPHTAFAAGPQPSGQTQSTQSTCSITVPENTPNSKLKALAKITPEQAKAAAKAAVPGDVRSVRLEDDDGCLVYSVKIRAADGKIHEVNVDAGTGKVLDQEVADAEDEDED